MDQQVARLSVAAESQRFLYGFNGFGVRFVVEEVVFVFKTEPQDFAMSPA